MIIVDTQCKTVKFISTKFETQYNKCQKFKHTTTTCNVLTKCQFCANTHNTHDQSANQIKYARILI